MTNPRSNVNSAQDHGNNVDNTNDKPHVIFQDEQDQFVPMNTNAVPFYKRARGCNSSEIKALERAAALDEMASNGKPPRWSYQLAPYPNYMGPLTDMLVDMRHRHALAFTQDVARALRANSESAAEQSRLNWNTVQQSYGNDTNGADRAQSRLAAMTTKERERERARLSSRAALHDLNPITRDEIRRNLNGESVPIPTPQCNNAPNNEDANDNNAGASFAQAQAAPVHNN